MMNAKERMEMLKKAGISVNDMLQFIMENEGVNVQLMDDGVKIEREVEVDLILAIKRDGYLHNPLLFRRWIMAQMFRMLNYEPYGYRTGGYTGYLDDMLPWDYQIKFLIDEVERIICIQKDGDATEYERECQLNTIKKVCKEVYEMTAEAYKDKARDNKYWNDALTRMRFAYEDVTTAYTYRNILPLLKEFYRRMPKMNITKKSPAFKDLYKGIGGYWTAKNLIMYHNCTMPGCNQHQTMQHLEEKARDFFTFDGEGWKMLGFMRELIEVNDFDYHKSMVQLGVHKEYGRLF